MQGTPIDNISKKISKKITAPQGGEKARIIALIAEYDNGHTLQYDRDSPAFKRAMAKPSKKALRKLSGN